MKYKKTTVWKTTTVILGVLLVISIFTNGFNFKKPSGITGKTATLTAQKAADKAVRYINSYLVQPGITASLISVKDNGDLYNAQIDIGGRGYDSYITKDGRLLFPNAVDLDDTSIAAPTQTDTSTVALEVDADDDASLGSEDVPVTIIEFSDYECPFCKRHFTQVYPEIKSKYIDTGKARLVFRDFPLSFHDPLATEEAMAAECAREQGGDKVYFEYHDLIFETTSSNGRGMQKSQLYDLAEQVGVDKDKFTECLDSEKYKEEVQKDIADGQAAGVSGTPAFLINGKLVSGAQPFEVFKQIIDAELTK